MRPSCVLVCLALFVPLATRASTVRIEERPFPDHEHLLVLGVSPRTIVSVERQTLLLDDPAGHLRLARTTPRARYVQSIRVQSVGSERGRLVVMLAAGVSARSRVERTGIAIDLTTDTRTNSIVHDTPHQSPATEAKQGANATPGATPDRLPEVPPPFLASVEGAVDKVLAKAPLSGSPAAPADGRTSNPNGPLVPIRTGTSGPPDVFRLPFSRGSGVAVRKRGDDLLVIFDQERSVDTTMIARDPRIEDATTRAADGTTELRLRFKGTPLYELLKDDNGWSFRLKSGGRSPSSVALRQEHDTAVLFDVGHAGRSVVVPDPDTGQILLVGTTTMPGQGVDAGRRSALFSIEKTDGGVIVEPSSDHVQLRPVESGFVLETDDGSSLHVPDDFTGVHHLADQFRRILDLPSGSIADLSRRLRVAMMSVAATPIRDRLDSRLSCVETLLSLGLGREAATLLTVALADAPAASGDERVRLLRTMIGVLDPASGPADVRSLPEADARAADDGVFWNALADRPIDRADRQRDADQVRGDLNLYLAYPPLLARAISGRVAETLLAGGSAADLKALATMSGGPQADIPKALAEDRLGHPAEALKALVAIEHGADRVRSVEATRREVEIRSREGTLAPLAAAAILATRRLDWRLAGEDGPVLLEEAGLRLKGRQIVQGLALLRQAGQADPALREAVSEATGDAIGRLADPHDADGMPDADFVSLSDQYADLIRSDSALSVKVAAIRAEKLARLGLPGRGAEAIESVLAAAPPGPDRAGLELRAAELRLQQGDTDASARSLRAADADAVPPPLATRRALVAAHLLVKAGHPQEALAALRDSTDPATLDAKADLLADTGDWKGSEGALAPLVTALPPTGPLSAHGEDLVLRLATSAFRAGDKDALRELDRLQAGRLTEAADRVALARFARLDDALTQGLPGAGSALPAASK